MKRGFIPLVVIAIIGLVGAVTAGGGYAVYKYSEVAKEKKVIETQLNEQKDKEIQRLQDQVDVLQDETGTSTEDTIDDEKVEDESTPAQIKDVSIVPRVEAVADAPVVIEENFAPILATAWNNFIDNEQKFLDAHNEMLDALNADLQGMKDLKKKSIALRDEIDATHGSHDEWVDYLIETYSNDIEWIQETVEGHEKITSDLRAKIASEKETARKISQTFITKEYAMSEVQTLNGYSFQEYADSQSNLFEMYYDSFKSRKNFLEEFFATIKKSMGSSQTSVPTYTPTYTPMPVINIPRITTTNTSCSVSPSPVGGGTIHCSSYNY